MSVCIQAGSTCLHFSSHSSNSKTCWAIEFHFIYKLYSQNRNHFYIFFNLLKPKIYRTWQIYMLVGKSVGHHGCGNFWGCLGISLLYYCTLLLHYHHTIISSYVIIQRCTIHHRKYLYLCRSDLIEWSTISPVSCQNPPDRFFNQSQDLSWWTNEIQPNWSCPIDTKN